MSASSPRSSHLKGTTATSRVLVIHALWLVRALTPCVLSAANWHPFEESMFAAGGYDGSFNVFNAKYVQFCMTGVGGHDMLPCGVKSAMKLSPLVFRMHTKTPFGTCGGTQLATYVRLRGV